VETGLDYRGARYYDSDVARFLSLDPLAAKFAEWSDYNYVLGNPVMLVDLDGRYPIIIHVRAFAPFDYFAARMFKGDGDSRPFSTSEEHTSRIRQMTSYETTTSVSNSIGWGSESHSRYGASAYSEGEVTYDQSYGNRIYTRLSGDMDALIPGIDWGGPTSDIDVWTDVRINTIENDDGSSTLSITGDVAGDGFPSTEAFVSDQYGNSVFLGVGEAKAGPDYGPFILLMGDRKEKQFNINTKIAVDKDGKFTGVYDGDNLISIDDWNQNFEEQDPKGND
jgi:hypothetical protein